MFFVDFGVTVWIHCKKVFDSVIFKARVLLQYELNTSMVLLSGTAEAEANLPNCPLVVLYKLVFVTDWRYLKDENSETP